MQQGTGTSVVLGLLAQVCFAVGFTFVSASAAKGKLTLAEEVFRTGLVISVAGVTALAVAGCLWCAGFAGPEVVKSDSWVWFVGGSVLAILVGEVFYLAGMSAKNLTTVAYTALAFPVFAFTIDWWRGKAELAVKDVVAFLLMAAGFVLLVYSPGKEPDGQ